jgi:hypothetical protein
MTNKLNLQENSATKILNMIYDIRGKQVMVDSDLAKLYQVETKVLNQAVRRNISRFPAEFMFQLNQVEYDNLRSQIVTSSFGSEHGGRRFAPFVFTEQGIAMLSAVLRSDVAIEVSIRIMNAFVEMRKFISNNSLLFEKLSILELKQLEFENTTDQKFNLIFDQISANEDTQQKIFFNGQIYDAYSFIVRLVKSAKSGIILIDNYLDLGTLDLLSKKKQKVDVTIYSSSKNPLSNSDIQTFNKQYPTLLVKNDESFHDRFLIIDRVHAYHIGASLKDAGKKTFAISKLEDKVLIQNLLGRLN